MTSKTRRGNNLPSEIGDRFSCLSDEIISHILSFLPVKSAVRTSILSKRWQNLWNFITNLEFEENTLIATSSVYDVEHVLSCCTSPHINKFSLTVNCYVHDERLESWINYVIKRNVRELRLEGPVFPHCIFTCKTLTVLELESGVLFDDEDIPTCSDIDSDSDTDSDVLFDNKDIRIPTSFDLPNLKTFRSCLLYYSCDFMEKLLSSSPLLEDLTIEGTVTSDFIFDLSCPLLKRLKIVLRGRKERKDVQCKIVINAPNLEYLELVDISTVEYDVENLTSIAEVKIDTRWEVFVNRSILWLFRAIDTLKSLSLHDIFISVLNSGQRRDLPTFYNMNRLELFGKCYSHQSRIACLLNVCPNLEVLILHKVSVQYYDRELPSLLGDKRTVPECLLSCLEVIKLDRFEGNKEDMEMVKYFLANARVLKKLTIKSNLDLNVCKRLLDLPMSSPTCKIHLC